MTQPAIPACVANAATLQPGVYYDANPLSALTTSCDTVNLSPGVYYLNFPVGDDAWDISRRVVATCDSGGQGAQLVFAGEAHVRLSGSLEIPCGRRATATGPLIAIMGLKTDITQGTAQNYTLRPTGATSSTFSNLPGALTTFGAQYPVDGTPSNVSLSSGTASLAATGLSQTGFPGGLPLTLQIAHGVTGQKADASVTVKEADGTVCSIDLAEAGMTTESKPVSCAGFGAIGPFDVTYTLNSGGKAAQAAVDGIQLTASATPQTIAKQAGCVVKGPGESGFCSLISPPSNGKGVMLIEGVVYIPNSTIAGKFNNTGNFKIASALIARSFDVDINPNLDGTPTIGSTVNEFTDGTVLFEAKIAGQSWISSHVEFPDGGEGNPVIKSWVIKK
jgi:hypothetical protein